MPSSTDSITQQNQYTDKSKKLLGANLVVPWQRGAKFWFPEKDRLWVSVGNIWILWNLDRDRWRRIANGVGELYVQPPIAMGLMVFDKKSGELTRKIGSLSQVDWESVSTKTDQWPKYDPAWLWCSKDLATTAWGSQWGKYVSLKECQREALKRTNRSEWITSSGLRASVRGWLPYGPEVALREPYEVAWVWVGHKVIMKKLQSNNRLTLVRKSLKIS